MGQARAAMFKRRRWMRVEDGHVRDVHVLPINDLRTHAETRACWCRPALLVNPDADVHVLVVVHHSADGRELFELPSATTQ